MTAPHSPLTRAALEIWNAGVAAVDSARLVATQVSTDADGLEIAGHRWQASQEGRICVVGAGKAGAGMARGLEQALGTDWLIRTSGWVNVPEDCVQPLQKIHLHGARPPGLNEPTQAGVNGTEEIFNRVRSLRSQDLCLVLISGGGSALLPSPVAGITLTEKQQVTRTLMNCGATISELNTVRRSLSKTKGGGLLRACRAGMLVTLIISDVIGDPLETIASGPTVPVTDESQQALNLLQHFSRTKGAEFPSAVMTALGHAERRSPREELPPIPAVNVVIGNNRTAVQASAFRARELGFQVMMEEWDQAGEAAAAGRVFAQHLRDCGEEFPSSRLCLVSGGETTVDLSPRVTPGKGGRNQEFALAAVEEWSSNPLPHSHAALVSAGTDGEDGPTDAAGAWVDADMLARVRQSAVPPARFLLSHDSYSFFEMFGGLLKTGPTQTNVMDLRVGLIEP